MNLKVRMLLYLLQICNSNTYLKTICAFTHYNTFSIFCQWPQHFTQYYYVIHKSPIKFCKIVTVETHLGILFI